jgi:hypothetical protein
MPRVVCPRPIAQDTGVYGVDWEAEVITGLTSQAQEDGGLVLCEVGRQLTAGPLAAGRRPVPGRDRGSPVGAFQRPWLGRWSLVKRRS